MYFIDVEGLFVPEFFIFHIRYFVDFIQMLSKISYRYDKEIRFLEPIAPR
jgi:hypothetical protein